MILYPTALSMRQKPPPGSRVAQPISGGFWLPGVGGGVTDSAGCNAPATVIGGVTRVQGPFGGPALKFDNASGYVDCGLSGNTAFNWASAAPFARTFWAWVRRPSAGSVGPLFAKGNNSPNSGWSVSINTTSIDLGFVGSTNGRIAAPANLVEGEWHQVCVSWPGAPFSSIVDNPGACAIYVNGRRAPSTANNNAAGLQNGTDVFKLWIGHAEYVGGTGGAVSAWADLEIDHWGFDHRLYGDADVADLYRRPFRHFAPAPVFGRFITGSAAAAGRPRIFVCT